MPRRRTNACKKCGFLNLARTFDCENCGAITPRAAGRMKARALGAAITLAVGAVAWWQITSAIHSLAK
jgi:hypothetical protein